MIGLGGMISGGIGALGGVMKMVQGTKMQNRAQQAINNFEWDDLHNPFASQQISRQGGDLQSEQAQLGFGTTVDALRGAGNRGILGGLGGAFNQNNMVNRQVASDWDRQQQNINMQTAQFSGKIQDMMEQRQSSELAGFGSLMNTGMGIKYQGLDNITNSAMSAGEAFDGRDKTEDE
jgi:hypothetical protein